MAGITYVDRKKGPIDDVVIVYPFTYVNPYLCLPPLGAEYLQAGAAAAGRKTTLLDMRFEDDVREHLERADLVCLYGFFEDCSLFGKWDVHITEEILAQVPEDTPVVAGGTGFGNPHATMAKYPRIDAHIVGLPNQPIQELLESGSPENIRCLTYRANGEVVQNERVTHRLPDDLYSRRDLRTPGYRYQMMGIPIELVRAAMGCNYHCRFCYQYGKDTDGNYLRWQGRSPQSQFNELKEIEAPLILWVDDDMTTDMPALDALADLLIESKVRKIMIGTGRVDHVIKSDVSVLKKLERAGFLALAFGVESLNDQTLRFYRKGQTVEMALLAMDMLKQTNIMLVCNFLLGSPGETEEEMMEYLWFGGRYGIDHLVTNRLRVPDGSYLQQRIYDETGAYREGMERIRGRPLKRIKNRIKFGQGMPHRMLLTLLKVHRHRGLHLDPGYVVLSTLETITKHTWIGKTRILPVLFWLPKKIMRLPPYRWFTRSIAYVLTPPAWLLGWVLEGVERRVGIFSRLMPALFGRVGRKVLKKQKVHAQLVPTRPTESGWEARPSGDRQLVPAVTSSGSPSAGKSTAGSSTPRSGS